MRLVIAKCSVDYVGRLTAHLPSAVRLLLVKADGSVSVHADDRAYKPLNWMSPPCTVAEAEGVWRVTNTAGEQLVVTLEEVIHDSTHHLGIDPGLVKDGVEAHLQELLADRCGEIGEGFTLVRREFPTDIGPVDLLCRDADGAAAAVEVKRKAEIAGTIDGLSTASPSVTGRHVAVEVKRHATIQAVEQLTRYLEVMNRDPLLAPVRGVLVALSFTQQTRTLAAIRGIACVQVDYDALRGIAPLNPTLF